MKMKIFEEIERRRRLFKMSTKILNRNIVLTNQILMSLAWVNIDLMKKTWIKERI